jgi:hypothetical protein
VEKHDAARIALPAATRRPAQGPAALRHLLIGSSTLRGNHSQEERADCAWEQAALARPPVRVERQSPSLGSAGDSTIWRSLNIGRRVSGTPTIRPRSRPRSCSVPSPRVVILSEVQRSEGSAVAFETLRARA